MNRYVIKFSKDGALRYISHLDMLRLFKRSFKRAGVRLQYSHGFNPHPKMSFAQPLSLGYTSSGEYIEFDTAEPYKPEAILEKLNSVLPEGIALFSCRELTGADKSLAALTEYAGYEIRIPLENGFNGDIRNRIESVVEGYMSQERIIIQKRQKKSGKEIEVDIKPLIAEISGMVNDNYIMITTKLAAGNTANLSPEAVLTTFCEFAGISCDRSEVSIKRAEIYFNN